jgi:hypothetical protein
LVTKTRNPASATLMGVVLAIIVLSLSLVFVKAVHHRDPAQPRAPMHDSK